MLNTVTIGVTQTAHWKQHKAKLLKLAMSRAEKTVRRIMLEKAREIITGWAVPEYRSQAEAFDPLRIGPHFSDKPPALGPTKNSEIKEDARQSYAQSAEGSFLANVMATLQAQSPQASTVTIPIEQRYKMGLEELAVVHKTQGQHGIVHLGMFSVAELDAMTRYQSKLVLYPGPLDPKTKKHKWLWWQYDHWEANAFVLNADGSSHDATQRDTLFQWPAPPSNWRAAGAKGHGYWADVEYGAILPSQPRRQGPEEAPGGLQVRPGQSMLTLFAHGASPSEANSIGGRVAETSYTFLLGNRPYLPLTRMAAGIYVALEQAQHGSGPDDDPFAE